MADTDLSKLSDDQLDLLDKYHKQGMGSLSDKELDDFNSIVNPSRMQRLGSALSNTASRLKPIGVGLAKVPGVIADTFNQTTQTGKEPDIQKEGITSMDQLADKFSKQPKEDDSYAGAIGKAIGYQPKDKLDEYLEAGATGAGAAALSPGTALRAIPRMLYMGAVPQVAAKAAGETAAATGASPAVQQGVSFATGLFSPYAATKLRTPLPVKDPQRRVATQTLNEAGVKTTAGQDTGRQWLQSKEATANPDTNENQSRQFTNAITTELGQPSEAVTIGQGGYLPTVGRDIKRNMDNVSNRNSINLGVMSPAERLDVRSSLEQIARDNPHHVDDIVNLARKHTGWPAPNMIGAGSNDEKIWRTIYPGARVIPGQDYQRLRSRLWSEANDIASSDPTRAESFRETARSLDRAMAHSIGRQNPADANAFQNARQLLENHMVVEKARSKSKGSDQISPDKLASAARQVVGDRRYNAGDTPYQSLATAAQKAMPALKGKSKDWSHAGLAGTAAGAVAGAIAPLLAMKHGSGLNAATEAGIYSLLEAGSAAAVPTYLGSKLAPTTWPFGGAQRYLRNQTIPAIPQNAGARQRNAAMQAILASQPPTTK
jgi:hypothetical protein